jgi:carboxylesterase type B
VLGKIDEQHNTALMVEQSIRDGQPVISGSIQYRLGAFGYLHTPESGNANLALNDQRNALLWIQKFVEGFGGNRKKVTVFGESAGSMSICAHMLSDPPLSGPLFQRAILMSGIIGTTSAPTSLENARKNYKKFLERMGIQEEGEAGLELLRQADVQKIVEASAEQRAAGDVWLSVQDPEWFGDAAGSVTWDRIPELLSKCDWVNEIVLGTTGFEVRRCCILARQEHEADLNLQGTTFMSQIAAVTPAAFLSGIAAQLGEESAELVSKAYGISPNMDQNLFLIAGARWMGDVVFDGEIPFSNVQHAELIVIAPTHQLAQYLTQKTNKKVYRYVFDVRNPFPSGPFWQRAHHWVDVYFVFKTFQFRYPTQRLKEISTNHARTWVGFANGNTPWKEYKYTGKGDEVLMVADERDGWVERTVGEHERLVENSWRRCEALVESWDTMRGKEFSPFFIEPMKAGNAA